VPIGTCGCCSGADGAANANRIHCTPSPVLIARGPCLADLSLDEHVDVSPALISGPTAPAKLTPGIGIPGKTKGRRHDPGHAQT